ncbi:MAG: DUF4130 domain-containing protein, partial [Rhizomicrobium sp.]
MRRVSLQPGADLDGFRRALRRLIADDLLPRDVMFDSSPALFTAEPAADAPPIALPRRVADLIALLICHRDPERYALLYQLVWRLRHGEPCLPEIASDPLVHRLHRMEKSLRRDLHKMHAFVRFRKTAMNGRERMVAWFETHLQNLKSVNVLGYV